MEDSTKEQRNAREEEVIATVFDSGKQCYNLTLRAVSREGKRNKRPRSEGSRNKVAEALKAKHQKDVEFHQRSVAHVKQLHASNRKQYNVSFVSPSGENHGPFKDIVEIRAFCMKLGLNCAGIVSLAQRKAKSCHGWVLLENTGYKYQRGNFTGKGGNAKNWSVTLVSPTGEEHSNIVNLAAFAREQKLGSGIYGLARGDYASYHGWTRG